MEDKYELLLNNITKLCNNIVIEENKNKIKIIYLKENINQNDIDDLMPKPQILKNTSHKKNNICYICLDSFNKKNLIRSMITCDHYFHKECIDKWFITSGKIKCPICRD